jgi:hypothetical protein
VRYLSTDGFLHGSTAPSRPRPPHCRSFTITLRHITLSRTPLDEWSARSRDLYLTPHNTLKRQTSMSPAGFERVIRASERPQTHALRRRGHWDRRLYCLLRRNADDLVCCSGGMIVRGVSWSTQRRVARPNPTQGSKQHIRGDRPTTKDLNQDTARLYKLWSYSVSSFLQLHVIFPLLGPNKIFFSGRFSQVPSRYGPPAGCQKIFPTHIK